MNKEDLYMSLPFDLAGARSKNRFRLELLWGVGKMFDLYNKSDFTIVFDHVCDIEVHLDNKFEFYQIKTHNVSKPYTLDQIIKLKNGSSVLGKLFILKNCSEQTESNIKLAIVSNSYFKHGKKVRSDMEKIDLSMIDGKSIDKIKQTLKNELEIDEVDISNVFYIFTSMNLIEPENDIKGKITGAFEIIKGCEPKKPNALYRLIYDTVSTKACYELRADQYEMIVEKKGITKTQLDDMLNKHMDKADNSVNLTKNYIETIENFKEKYRLKNSLAKVVSELQKSKELRTKEKNISSYILENLEQMPDEFEGIVDNIIGIYGDTFSPEYSKSEIYIFIVLILKRCEEGVYEQVDI